MAYLGGLGSNATKTVGSTLAITAASTIPAGTVLILGISWDNLTATTPTISSVSASGGGSWVEDATANVGVSLTPGSGIFAAVYTTTTTSQINSGATVTTITWSSASTASKAAAIVGHSDQLDSLRGAVVSATSTGGAPSATTTTAPVTGDVVIGVILGENNATPTGDADTLNGSWSTIYGTASTGAGAATNVAVGIQSKTVTAGGNQTFNATTSNDSVAFVFTLATPLQATFGNGSNTSLTSGNFAPTITYVPQMTGTSSSQNPPAQTAAAIGIKTTATASGQSNSSGNLPAPTLTNTFVLQGQSNSAGSLAAGIKFPASASGGSNTFGNFAPRITYVPLFTGQSNSAGSIATLGTIRSTMSGQSTTTGSLAAFRAVGATLSGQSNSSGSGVITATRRPQMTGQSNSAGNFTPTIAYKPILTGQSSAAGSFKVGIDSPGTMTATAFTYGALSVGRKFDTTLNIGESTSAGSVAATFTVGNLFIGWGAPL